MKNLTMESIQKKIEYTNNTIEIMLRLLTCAVVYLCVLYIAPFKDKYVLMAHAYCWALVAWHILCLAQYFLSKSSYGFFREMPRTGFLAMHVILLSMLTGIVYALNIDLMAILTYSLFIVAIEAGALYHNIKKSRSAESSVTLK